MKNIHNLKNRMNYSLHYSMEESQNNNAEWKKPEYKAKRLDDSIYVKLWNMQSNPQSKKAGCMGMRKKHRVEGL